jgi:KDO2-lipid IV(A) lauroyltransferase
VQSPSGVNRRTALPSSSSPPLAWARGAPDERRAWRRYWIDDVVMGTREIGLHYALRALPIDACSAVGARIGPLVGPLDRKADARLAKTLALLRPGWSPAEVEAARVRNWRNVGRTMAEFSALPRLWRSGRTTVVGEANMAAARAHGPRIYVGVHLGNWELLGPKLLAMGEDGAEFYQPPRNRFQRWIAERTRRRFDGQLLPPGPSSTVAAIRRLRDGRGVVIFMDEFTKGRVNGPALGRPLTPSAALGTAVRLALSTGAVIVPAYVLRTGGAHFTMHLLDPITPAGLSVETAMARVNATLEPVVIADVEQWYMAHELRDLTEPPAGAFSEPTAPRPTPAR